MNNDLLRTAFDQLEQSLQAYIKEEVARQLAAAQEQAIKPAAPQAMPPVERPAAPRIEPAFEVPPQVVEETAAATKTTGSATPPTAWSILEKIKQRRKF